MGENLSVPGASTAAVGGPAADVPDAQPAIIDAALAAVAAQAERQLVRVRRQRRDRASAHSAPRSAGWRSSRGAAPAARCTSGPGTCPHLGADLSTGTVDCGALICPWHGLRLDGRPRVRLEALSRPRRRRAGLGAPRPRRRRGADRRSRCCRPARQAPVCTRSPGWSAPASRATSSPTGSTRGTAAGFTRIRSRSSRCCPHRHQTPTYPRSRTASSCR